jgi:hypothetical protein
MHDPEKWNPVFGKDHAQTNAQGRRRGYAVITMTAANRCIFRDLRQTGRSYGVSRDAVRHEVMNR